MSAVIAHQQLPATKYIYNHDIMNCTDVSVVGNHLYSGRALGITEPWDMIQLHEDLKPLWPDITKHYRRIGLSHSKDVVWFLNLKQIGAHVGYQPSVFYRTNTAVGVIMNGLRASNTSTQKITSWLWPDNLA